MEEHAGNGGRRNAGIVGAVRAAVGQFAELTPGSSTTSVMATDRVDIDGRAAVEEGGDDETAALRERVIELEELVRRAGPDGRVQAIEPDGGRS